MPSLASSSTLTVLNARLIVESAEVQAESWRAAAFGSLLRQTAVSAVDEAVQSGSVRPQDID